MLKITTHKHSDSTTFQLEGRLAGPWVEELKRCWTSAATQAEKHPFSLDLSGVTYVDTAGKELLKAIHREGATLVASGCLMNCLVRELTQTVQGGEQCLGTS